MTIEMMRSMVSDAYPAESWKNRVKNMKDNQVAAVYFNFLRSGRFEKKPEKTQYRQMTLFDNEFIEKIW